MIFSVENEEYSFLNNYIYILCRMILDEDKNGCDYECVKKNTDYYTIEECNFLFLRYKYLSGILLIRIIISKYFVIFALN